MPEDPAPAVHPSARKRTHAALRSACCCCRRRRPLGCMTIKRRGTRLAGSTYSSTSLPAFEDPVRVALKQWTGNMVWLWWSALIGNHLPLQHRTHLRLQPSRLGSRRERVCSTENCQIGLLCHCARCKQEAVGRCIGCAVFVKERSISCGSSRPTLVRASQDYS